MSKHRKLTIDELDRVGVEEFRLLDKNPIVVVLDNIRSANNVGSFFRTADAFRISKIFLCGITAVPPNREIQKTALGATESVEWEYAKNTLSIISALKQKGYTTVAIEQATNSIMLHEFDLHEYPLPIAAIFGNEVSGVSQDVIDCADCCVEIKQLGTKHSLNVAVAGGILLWSFLQKNYEKFVCS